MFKAPYFMGIYCLQAKNWRKMIMDQQPELLNEEHVLFKDITTSDPYRKSNSFTLVLEFFSKTIQLNVSLN